MRPNIYIYIYIFDACALTSLMSLQSFFMSYNSQVQIVRGDEDPTDEKLIVTAPTGAADI